MGKTPQPLQRNEKSVLGQIAAPSTVEAGSSTKIFIS
jgi:hypothetical protein